MRERRGAGDQEEGRTGQLGRRSKWGEAQGKGERTRQLGRRVGMRPDFQYFEGDKNVCEDVKGFKTSDYTLRKAIFKALFPHITFVES